MKICTHCKVGKLDGEFRKDRTRKSGLQSWCAVCQDAIKKTPEGRRRALEVMHRYQRTEKGKAAKRRAQRKWHSSQAYKSSHAEQIKQRRKRYWSSPSGIAAKKRNKIRYRANPENRQKIIARRMVQSAVRNGTLSKPTCCPRCLRLCDKPKELHAHHFRGYEKPNWLTVEWLCNQCHPKICPA